MATDLKSPPATFKSKIWKHFGFRQEDKDGKVVTEFTTCRHCDMNVSYKCGNTTNMATHLKRHHKDIYESLSHELSRKKEKTTTQESSNTSCTTGQLRLQDVLHKRMTFSSPRAVAITKSIGQFIAVDMRPFSVVETSGFKHMINTLEPKYSIPSRAHFSEKIIPEIYSESVNRVKNELSQADFIALTTDGWTSKATQSYNTTRPLFESHTAENLADVLQETVKEWKLKRTVKVEEVLSDKRIAVATDNASNIVKGVNLAGFEPHIRCFAHCLNLAAHKAMQINSVSRLLGRMRRIVTFFHSSSTATKKLKDKQKALNLPAKRLVQDVKTRWNSSFDMMSTFLEQQPAVYATLTEKDIKKNLKEVVTLSDTDISLAEELVDVLKPLKTITTIMCEEKSPTISLVHLMKERLLRQLRENESDSGLAAHVKTEIRNDIESRYSDPDIIRWLEMCCALDPRFKTLPYHDQVEANRVYGNLVDMMTESEEEVFLHDLIVEYLLNLAN
ncbi:E3 SUMO-protein ligase ZBED1-like [Ylistrum balloti]|uniref:E3 SUMO-protein ligase ZBED1-like n=1 Tax=Ylistrum balloti TaxID=509963 RepID=UPI002905AD0D|nr:E3 SUMO-protein ligase ZBED1-like [Ylistrum balloti]